MRNFFESLETRTLLSASVAPAAAAAPAVQSATHVSHKAAAVIPNLVGVYRGSYVANSFFEITFTNQAKGKLKGHIFGLAFAAVPNSATLTVPLTGTVDSKGAFNATAKGFVKGAAGIGTVNYTYSFTGKASPNGATIKGKLTITTSFKGHSVPVKLNFTSTKNP